MNVSERLKFLMDERGLTVYGLAKKADVSWTTVKNLFNRTGNPTVATLELFCNAMDITMAQFFSTEENQQPPAPELQRVINHWDHLTDREKQIILNIVDTSPDTE